MVIRDDYNPWTASTLRLSIENLLPTDEVAGELVFVGRHGNFGAPRAIG